MKHKKDLPRKYRKYVRWALVNQKTNHIVTKLHSSKSELVDEFYSAEGESYCPVLCLPLSMISVELCCNMGKYFPHPRINAKVPK